MKVVHKKASLPVIRGQSLALTSFWQENSFTRKSINRLRKTGVVFYAMSLTGINLLEPLNGT